MQTDESRRRRHRRHGGHGTPATPMRFRPDVSRALADEAERERTTKVAIVEDMLIARYRLEAS